MVWARGPCLPWSSGPSTSPLDAMGTIVHADHRVAADWPFSDPPGLGCATTRQVMEEREPIRSILHFEDGEWLFTCDSTDDPDDGMIVCLACLYERFPAIASHAALPPGNEAWLDEDTGEWVITPIYEDE